MITNKVRHSIRTGEVMFFFSKVCPEGLKVLTYVYWVQNIRNTHYRCTLTSISAVVIKDTTSSTAKSEYLKRKFCLI